MVPPTHRDEEDLTRLQINEHLLDLAKERKTDDIRLLAVYFAVDANMIVQPWRLVWGDECESLSPADLCNEYVHHIVMERRDGPRRSEPQKNLARRSFRGEVVW